MASWQYTKGLHDLGGGAYAYLQPDGSWGWSNAGLVTDGDQSLLVDTLFDERLTAEMLATMRAAAPASKSIGTVVNTHANGDHTYGNRLVADARIIASKAAAEEMNEAPPEMLAGLVAQGAALGPVGEFFASRFAPFDFAGVGYTQANETFEGTLTVTVGDKKVELIEVGPAHTKGDVLVHVPADRVVYTGDILFIDGTPIMWTGPVRNWLAACDRIIAMDAIAIVPGHGPITDAAGVRRVQDYLRYVDGEARQRYDAGMTWQDAARDIALGDFSAWGDAERIAVNVSTLYREYSEGAIQTDITEQFGMMAELAR